MPFKSFVVYKIRFDISIFCSNKMSTELSTIKLDKIKKKKVQNFDSRSVYENVLEMVLRL